MSPVITSSISWHCPPYRTGTGLGLSVAYQIVVDKHGGHLSCVSAPGAGAQFTIEIPV